MLNPLLQHQRVLSMPSAFKTKHFIAEASKDNRAEAGTPSLPEATGSLHLLQSASQIVQSDAAQPASADWRFDILKFEILVL